MQELSELFKALHFWHWFSFSAVLGILDILLGASFFLIWMGISAFTVGVIVWALPTLAWQYQMLIFTLQSLASVVFWHLYLKKHPTVSDRPRLNRRAEQYINRVFTLEQAIVNRRGKITVDDSNWRIEGVDLPAGTTVKVVGVEGVILKVKPHP